MAQCRICNTASMFISESLGACLACIRERPEKAIPVVAAVHAKTRVQFNLPKKPPKAPRGKPCKLCVNECRMADGQAGYCGLRKNVGGRLIGVSAKKGKLSRYQDPLPTNCVGSWICAGGTGAGYPKYVYRNGPERGYQNLAVFFHACTFNCLYCQNWHFKEHTLSSKTCSVQSLVSDTHGKTSCISSFIASIDPNIPYSLLAFHPQFYIHDLPLSTKSFAQRCVQKATDAGLKNVKIGNLQLLT